MRILGKIVFVPVAFVVVLFAIANRDPVTVSFWPLPFEAAMPLYLVALGVLAVGIVLGALASTVTIGKWRWRARSSARRTRVLEKERAAESVTLPASGRDPVPASGQSDRAAIASPAPAALPAARRRADLDDA